MKRFFGLLLAGLLLFPLVAGGEIIDRIVAIVNDDIITMKELEKFVLVEKKSGFTSVDEYFQGLQIRDKMDAFVETLLIKQQARKLKLEVTDKEVEAVVDNIKKQNLITDAELKEQLKKENIVFKDFTEGIRTSILRTKVLSRAIASETMLSDQDLKKYYDAHLEELKEEEYRVQHIFVSGQKKDAQARAQAAYKLLQEGKPFEEVVREYSDEPNAAQGGDIGWVKRADLIPELREGIKLLIPGTFSGVIRTSYGYHIIKLIQMKKVDAQPFEAMKDKLRERIIQEESDRKYKEYIQKLRAASYIEVKI
jgi:peptidyl-prolyl cis-trans isomerase SurA